MHFVNDGISGFSGILALGSSFLSHPCCILADTGSRGTGFRVSVSSPHFMPFAAMFLCFAPAPSPFSTPHPRALGSSTWQILSPTCC
jgi:hypothetical protein